MKGRKRKRWRVQLGPGEAALFALGLVGCMAELLARALTSQPGDVSGVGFAAALVGLFCVALAVGLFRDPRATSVGLGQDRGYAPRSDRDRSHPPRLSDYDIVAEAEHVAARAHAYAATSLLADVTVDVLRAELAAYGRRSWRRWGRGAVVLDLRPMAPLRFSYVPRERLARSCTRGRLLAPLLCAAEQYRPSREVVVVVRRHTMARAYWLVAGPSGDDMRPAPFLDIER